MVKKILVSIFMCLNIRYCLAEADSLHELSQWIVERHDKTIFTGITERKVYTSISPKQLEKILDSLNSALREEKPFRCTLTHVAEWTVQPYYEDLQNLIHQEEYWRIYGIRQAIDMLREPVWEKVRLRDELKKMKLHPLPDIGEAESAVKEFMSSPRKEFTVDLNDIESLNLHYSRDSVYFDVKKEFLIERPKLMFWKRWESRKIGTERFHEHISVEVPRHEVYIDATRVPVMVGWAWTTQIDTLILNVIHHVSSQHPSPVWDSLKQNLVSLPYSMEEVHDASIAAVSVLFLAGGRKLGEVIPFHQCISGDELLLNIISPSFKLKKEEAHTYMRDPSLIYKNRAWIDLLIARHGSDTTDVGFLLLNRCTENERDPCDGPSLPEVLLTNGTFEHQLLETTKKLLELHKINDVAAEEKLLKLISKQKTWTKIPKLIADF